jgi:hypothetical protein
MDISLARAKMVQGSFKVAASGDVPPRPINDQRLDLSTGAYHRPANCGEDATSVRMPQAEY